MFTENCCNSEVFLLGVSDSQKFHSWQDEEQYEIVDVVDISSAAPVKGRRNAANKVCLPACLSVCLSVVCLCAHICKILSFNLKLPGLLDGCYFYLSGTFHPPTPSKEELVKLIQCGGGRVLHREPKDPNDWPTTVAYHENGAQKCSRFILYDSKCNHGQYVAGSTARYVPVSWLLDCIMQFRLLPLPNLAQTE
jgi:hypothetical protein